MVSGDSDDNGFNQSMDGCPWFAVPRQGEHKLEEKVPCTGYPTPGIVKADGTVVNADVFGKVNEEALKEWEKELGIIKEEEKRNEDPAFEKVEKQIDQNLAEDQESDKIEGM